MKKLMFSLFAAMMLIGVQAKAQDATNEKPIWQPSVDISLSYSSRYISEGNVGNPDAIDTLSLTLGWDITDNLSFHIGGVGIYDERHLHLLDEAFQGADGIVSLAQSRTYAHSGIGIQMSKG